MRNPNFPQSTDLHQGVLQQRLPTPAVGRGEDGTQQRPAEPSAATAAHPTPSWSIAAAAPTGSAPAAARRAVASVCGRRPVAAQATSGWSARVRPAAEETEERVELEGPLLGSRRWGRFGRQRRGTARTRLDLSAPGGADDGGTPMPRAPTMGMAAAEGGRGSVT